MVPTESDLHSKVEKEILETFGSQAFDAERRCDKAVSQHPSPIEKLRAVSGPDSIIIWALS